MTSSLPNEYTEVELPLVSQLMQMRWSHVEGSKWDVSASDRETFREVVLSRRLRAALRRINVDDVGNEWLDESRVAQAEAALLRSPTLKLIEANQEVTTLLLSGTTVDGIEVPRIESGGTKLVPVRVSVNGGEPAMAEV